MPIKQETVTEIQAALWDPSLPRITWPKVEIVLGLASAHLGLAVGARAMVEPGPGLLGWLDGIFSFVLFVLGCYLALAGHRSHLYTFQVRTTAIILQEMRKEEKP